MIWFVIAVTMHLVAGFYYMLSGLVAPVWAVLILWIVWLVLARELIRRRKEGPRTLLVPVAAGVIWFAALWLGEIALGWSA